MDAAARLPERLGVWPAAFLLFCFAALELAYADPASPRALALAIALYSYVMWFGMAAFGRRAWDEHGDGVHASTSACWRGSRRSASATGGSSCGCRSPASPARDRRPGCSRSSRSCSARSASTASAARRSGRTCAPTLEAPYILDAPGTAELIATGLGLAGLLGCILVVALAYLGGDEDRGGDGRFASARWRRSSCCSLVPIALVYAVAHYFTYLVVQGQYAIPLASDPFGYGWDLFGTIDYAPNIAPFSPNTIWYVQVGALVAGHVAGLAVAHDRAVTILPERDALRSQYAMLALMVLYTVGGLWLLSPRLVAHGGVGGAIVESLLALTIAALFLAVWLRERRGRSRESRPGARSGRRTRAVFGHG